MYLLTLFVKNDTCDCGKLLVHLPPVILYLPLLSLDYTQPKLGAGPNSNHRIRYEYIATIVIVINLELSFTLVSPFLMIITATFVCLF